MTNRLTRRQYLLTVGTAGTAVLAGCSEGGLTGTDGSDGDETETDEATTDGTDPTETATDEAGTVADSTSPELTLRSYFEAYADGDADTVGALTHPESSMSTGYVEELDLTIEAIERVTLSEMAEAEDIDISAAGLDDATAAIEDEMTDIGADDYTAVSYDVETDEYGAESGYVLLVESDGQWYLYTMQPTSYLYDNQDEGGGSGEVTNRLEVVSTVGNVDGDSISSVELTVGRAPGSGDVDLRRTTMRWIDSTGTYDLTSESEASSDEAFSVTAIQDDDSSISTNGTLNADSDRAMLTVDLSSLGGGFDEGDTATVQFETAAGGTTEVRLVIPETVTGDAVAL